MLRPVNAATIHTSYEPFSREPEYVEVNRLFIQSLQLAAHQRVLDLACGSGALTGLILECAPKVSVLGVDISREALELARTHLAAIGLLEKRAVNLVEAAAECLPVPRASIDAVIMGNAIQLCDDKDGLVSEIVGILRPGGIFAFNTSFYAGTYVSGTEGFYLRWIEEAVAYLRKKDADLRRAGARGIVRKKGQAKPAFSHPWLPVGEYRELLVCHGFEVKSVVERTVLLTQRSFESIGSYAGLASVVLSGYPVELACEALAKSTGAALAAVGMEVVPRLWAEFIAVKQ